MPLVPEGTPVEDAKYLALAALLLCRPEREPDARIDAQVDELAVLRQRRFEEHSLSRSRHPSSRRSA